MNTLPRNIDPADTSDPDFAAYFADVGLRDADRHQDATLTADELDRETGAPGAVAVRWVA